jgi:meso-butanediol dehydrogenase / (S,S)-butanediol dehydrogenase / diacetyl reductase
MSSFAGKHAIISGASTGIGAATARGLIAAGASLTILDVNAADGQLLNDDLIAQGGNSRFATCDVADPLAVRQAVDQEAGDGIDIVIANAAIGTMSVGGTVESIEPERWDLTFAINTRSVYAVCRAALPHMRKLGGGSIVVTSSLSALIGSTQRPTHAYAASKGALLSLVRAMAVSYGPEAIRVNAVLPGFVRTRLTEDILGPLASRQATIAAIPLRRYAEPDEIAACILFLASDEASFVTGSLLVADGGQSAV